jgi:bacterioferritin-associated ferredoxin
MCGVIQEMDVSAFHSTKVDIRDQLTTIVTVAYHCGSCGALARYEHIQEEPEKTYAA